MLYGYNFYIQREFFFVVNGILEEKCEQIIFMENLACRPPSPKSAKMKSCVRPWVLLPAYLFAFEHFPSSFLLCCTCQCFALQSFREHAFIIVMCFWCYYYWFYTVFRTHKHTLTSQRCAHRWPRIESERDHICISIFH